MKLWRRIRELFVDRRLRYGVRYMGGRYEKFDFYSRESAVDWAKAHLVGPFVVFFYRPLELAIDPASVDRSEHATPDHGQ